MASKILAIALLALVAYEAQAAPGLYISAGISGSGDTSASSNATSLLANMWGRGSTVAGAVSSAGRQAASSGLDVVGTTLTAGTSTANAALGAGITTTQQLVGAKNDLISAGSNFLGGLFRRITNLGRSVGSAVSNAATSTINAVQGLSDTILSRAGDAAASTGSIVGNVVQSNGRAINNGLETVRTLSNSATSNFNNAVDGTLDNVRARLTTSS